MQNHVISDPTLLSLWERQEILDAINYKTIKYKIQSCGDDVKRRSKYSVYCENKGFDCKSGGKRQLKGALMGLRAAQGRQLHSQAFTHISHGIRHKIHIFTRPALAMTR